jgi:hypothetical protein
VGGVFLVILSFKVKGLGGRLDELKQRPAGRVHEPGAAARL